MKPVEVATLCESGKEFIPFNHWHTQSVHDLDKLADAKFKLLGITYYIFEQNLYSCHEECLLRHDKDWKNELCGVANKLLNL